MKMGVKDGHAGDMETSLQLYLVESFASADRRGF